MEAVQESEDGGKRCRGCVCVEYSSIAWDGSNLLSVTLAASYTIEKPCLEEYLEAHAIEAKGYVTPF